MSSLNSPDRRYKNAPILDEGIEEPKRRAWLETVLLEAARKPYSFWDRFDSPSLKELTDRKNRIDANLKLVRGTDSEARPDDDVVFLEFRVPDAGKNLGSDDNQGWGRFIDDLRLKLVKATLRRGESIKEGWGPDKNKKGRIDVKSFYISAHLIKTGIRGFNPTKSDFLCLILPPDRSMVMDAISVPGEKLVQYVSPYTEELIVPLEYIKGVKLMRRDQMADHLRSRIKPKTRLRRLLPHH